MIFPTLPLNGFHGPGCPHVLCQTRHAVPASCDWAGGLVQDAVSQHIGIAPVGLGPTWIQVRGASPDLARTPPPCSRRNKNASTNRAIDPGGPITSLAGHAGQHCSVAPPDPPGS
jgi:hypothetical protein